jgi:hypothetical protein
MTSNGRSRSSLLIIIRSKKVVSSRSTRIRHLRPDSNSSRRCQIRIIRSLFNPDHRSRPRANAGPEIRARIRHKPTPTSTATLSQQDRLIRKNLNTSNHPQPLRLGLAPDYRSPTLCPAREMPTTRAIAIAMVMACTHNQCLGTNSQIPAAPLGQLRHLTMEETGQSSGLTRLHHR